MPVHRARRGDPGKRYRPPASFSAAMVDKYTWCDVGSSFLPGEITAAFLCAQMERADTITKRADADLEPLPGRACRSGAARTDPLADHPPTLCAQCPYVLCAATRLRRADTLIEHLKQARDTERLLPLCPVAFVRRPGAGWRVPRATARTNRRDVGADRPTSAVARPRAAPGKGHRSDLRVFCVNRSLHNPHTLSVVVPVYRKRRDSGGTPPKAQRCAGRAWGRVRDHIRGRRDGGDDSWSVIRRLVETYPPGTRHPAEPQLRPAQRVALRNPRGEIRVIVTIDDDLANIRRRR